MRLAHALPLGSMILGALACFSDPLPPIKVDDGGAELGMDTGTGDDTPTTTSNPTTTDDPDTDEPTTTDDPDTDDPDTDDPTDGGCSDRVCFEAVFELGAGLGPEDVVLADVTGDGVLDIVTANAGGDNVAVLRGLGGGNFANPTFYPAGIEPVAVAALNLDPESATDGGVDLVVGNRAGQSMSVLMNTGAPVAFGAPDIEILGVALTDLDVGNLTIDTNYESVVGAIGEVGILVTHGTGHGLAGDLDAAPTTNPTVAVATGFLTQDPYSDFVAVSDLGPSLTVIHFLAAPPYFDIFDLVIASAAHDVALASLDANAHLDLVVASAHLGLITVFPGDGNGLFLGPSVTEVYVGADSLAVGDLDGDGKVDVVYAASAANEVGVMLGSGDTSLAAPLTFEVGPRPMAVALADLDGDGKLDIVTANADGDNVSLLLSGR